MDTLSQIVEFFVKGKKDPRYATSAKVWIEKGGFESIKVQLIEYLQSLEMVKIPIVYGERMYTYTLPYTTVLGEIKRIFSSDMKIPEDNLVFLNEKEQILSSDTSILNLDKITASTKTEDKTPIPITIADPGLQHIYRTSINKDTTILQLKEFLSGEVKIPVTEQVIVIGSIEASDEKLVYNMWLASGKPEHIWLIKKMHKYDLIYGMDIFSVNLPYNSKLSDVRLMLAPVIKAPVESIVISGPEGVLPLSMSISEANRQGSLSINIASETVTRPTPSPLPVFSVPVAATIGSMFNITITSRTKIGDMKANIFKQTGIIPEKQYISIAVSDNIVQLGDDQLVKETLESYGNPILLVRSTDT